MLEAQCVSYMCGKKSLVRNVSLSLQPGQLTALLGPNGAGKTTLIKLMSGQLSATSGEVRFAGAPISTYSPEQLAARRAMLAQNRAVGFPFSAFDVVLMGRHPHAIGRGESAEDFERVESCLADTDSAHLAARIYNTLSGGESARVDMARVLAQDTSVLLLDEPTNHLDPRHQVAVLGLCKSLTRAGHSVAVCMHDLNLAAQYADHVLVMKNGCTVAQGCVEDTLTPDLLEEVYSIPFDVWQRPNGGICVMPALESVHSAQSLTVLAPEP